MNQRVSQTKSNNLVGISLALIVLLLYLAYQAIAPALAKNRQKAYDLKNEVQLAQAKYDSFSTAQSQITDLKEVIDKVNLAVPAGRDVPSILTSVEAIATKDGVRLLANQPKNGTLLTNPSSDNLNNLNFSISVNAGYPALSTFVQDIENNVRLMKVNSIALSPADSGNLTASLEISAYSRDIGKE